ncbi:MAG: hypothetical protein JNK15_16010 [Planctomycetes bacterium]|nr:hypothetical protein [Planctomycetota bacterium]
MIRPVAVVLVMPAVAAMAQVPAAPSVEGKAAVTPAEAMVFTDVLRLASAWRTPSNERFHEARIAPDYQLCLAGVDEVGGFHWTTLDAVPSDAPQVLAYFVPRVGGRGSAVFCVRSDGVWAMAENRADTAMHGGRALEPMDVLGEGGKGSLLDFPRTPTRGRDGNLWLPGELVRTTAQRVQVVDEAGAALGGVWVETVPADGDLALDLPVPGGRVRTLLEGDAVLVGLPARGFGLRITIDRATLPVARSAVRREGASLRVTVDRSGLALARRRANESAAIATLKNISSAQAQCQASGVIDGNGNGAGEYGTFAELSGRVPVRGGAQRITPPVLSTAFGNVQGGIVQRSGYCFRMFLPGKDGIPLAELPSGGADAKAVVADHAETMWCAYAWPMEPGRTGQRAFFVDHNGDVLAAANANGEYGGVDKAPAGNAARKAGGADSMAAPLAANAIGRDGQTWVVVN